MPTNTKPKQTLFDLMAELQALMDKMEENIDANLPDNHETLAQMLDEASGRLETKLDGYADYLAHAESKANTIKAEIARLSDLFGYWKAKQERLQKLLLYIFQSRGIVSLETDFHRFKLTNNGGVLPLKINDNVKPEDIAPEYPEMVAVVPSVLTFNNAAIRQHLEAGKPLEFASLGERGQRVTVK